jgi:hypothetical protein
MLFSEAEMIVKAEVRKHGFEEWGLRIMISNRLLGMGHPKHYKLNYDKLQPSNFGRKEWTPCLHMKPMLLKSLV